MLTIHPIVKMPQPTCTFRTPQPMFRAACPFTLRLPPTFFRYRWTWTWRPDLTNQPHMTVHIHRPFQRKQTLTPWIRRATLYTRCSIPHQPRPHRTILRSPTPPFGVRRFAPDLGTRRVKIPSVEPPPCGPPRGGDADPPVPPDRTASPHARTHWAGARGVVARAVAAQRR